MTDRALEAAAAQTLKHLRLAFGKPEGKGAEYLEVQAPIIAHQAIVKWLDHLLGELPEEAVAAMMESGGRGSADTTRELCERWLTEALRSLRGSLNTGDGV